MNEILNEILEIGKKNLLDFVKYQNKQWELIDDKVIDDISLNIIKLN